MYFITCFAKYEIDPKTHVPNIGANRTFGYYADRDVAIRMVSLNNLDIQECIYQYAVIEHIPEGLYNPAIERLFFKWNEDEEIFEEVDSKFFEDCWGNYAFG